MNTKYIVKKKKEKRKEQHNFKAQKRTGTAFLVFQLMFPVQAPVRPSRKCKQHSLEWLFVIRILFLGFSVHLHHTVDFVDKPEAGKESDSSSKEEEDEYHNHCVPKVQKSAGCSNNLQF